MILTVVLIMMFVQIIEQSQCYTVWMLHCVDHQALTMLHCVDATLCRCYSSDNAY